MRVNRTLLSVALVVVALVIQVSVLARLQLPGATPDLMLLVVLGLAFVYGHVSGALIGFGAGRGYDFGDFLDDVRASGLEPDLLLAGWDLRPFSDDDSDFLVAVLRPA